MAVERKLREKVGITYFGLSGHEIAALESMMRSLPDLADDFELRDPNRADKCDIVIVNKDSELANSWWTSYKERNRSAVPLFLSDDKQSADDGVRCKRPFLPSMLRIALQEIVDEQLYAPA
ncbi:MAG: hypothetical protein QNJ07_11585 [Woeseiaceae bacterium]|nr:hypothetical protein [Woeseiaceae bacterium]